MGASIPFNDCDLRTFALTGHLYALRRPRCSKESSHNRMIYIEGFGAGNRIRTYDLRITNAPLYQLSYSGIRTPVSSRGADIRRAAGG